MKIKFQKDKNIVFITFSEEKEDEKNIAKELDQITAHPEIAYIQIENTNLAPVHLKALFAFLLKDNNRYYYQGLFFTHARITPEIASELIPILNLIPIRKIGFYAGICRKAVGNLKVAIKNNSGLIEIAIENTREITLRELIPTIAALKDIKTVKIRRSPIGDQNTDILIPLIKKGVALIVKDCNISPEVLTRVYFQYGPKHKPTYEYLSFLLSKEVKSETPHNEDKTNMTIVKVQPKPSPIDAIRAVIMDYAVDPKEIEEATITPTTPCCIIL